MPSPEKFLDNNENEASLYEDFEKETQENAEDNEEEKATPAFNDKEDD
ncbi:MAG: hypothetical protein KAR24_03160 [Candidatus Pacebacteria bacterium]|nr:hypothetical protein [Candidatus Paceibacterota bacterium]